MIILIVGPSGVGKTAAIKAAQQELPETQFRHLDGLASRHAMSLGLIDRESVGLLRDTLRNDDLLLAVGLEAIGKFAGENP